MKNISEHIRLKRGLDISISGEAERITAHRFAPEGLFSLRCADFRGMEPRLLVKEGDRVLAGSPLWCDASRTEIKFASPVCGTVEAIVRDGDGRLQEVKVRASGEKEHVPFKIPRPAAMKRSEIVQLMLDGGLWPAIVQRPFGVVADPEAVPKAIFISAFSSAPLDADYDYSLSSRFEDIQAGIDILSRLTMGGVHLALPAGNYAGTVFHKLKGAVFHSFYGPHPAGNVGVQIASISPIRKGDIIWTVPLEMTAVIGRFFLKGAYDLSRKVAVAGPAAEKPAYADCVAGCPLETFAPWLDNARGPYRIVCGNILSGRSADRSGNLGFFDNLITLVPENGGEDEFMGWVRALGSPFRPSGASGADTSTGGTPAPFIVNDIYDKVLPVKIFPVNLFKACEMGDIKGMEECGIYEVTEEDVALCEYVCPSKIGIQELITKGIGLMLEKGEQG